MLTRFGRDQAGGVPLVFGLVLPLLLGAVAAAVEYGLLVHRRISCKMRLTWAPLRPRAN